MLVHLVYGLIGCVLEKVIISKRVVSVMHNILHDIHSYNVYCVVYLRSWTRAWLTCHVQLR